ncbi:hypothetical protein [Halotia branconii]|uniref:Uncharacterized protein n=1 Tax=Halotia branconii CENA392 TaxID=1539056 RepID=A0AAJ6NWI6_9CYAN|nr:hypothetical protein [Halotia branconii]WGV27922.1 hypothetical protein QI031_10755 [Halotia branconii CENA392]
MAWKPRQFLQVGEPQGRTASPSGATSGEKKIMNKFKTFFIPRLLSFDYFDFAQYKCAQLPRSRSAAPRTLSLVPFLSHAPCPMPHAQS